MIQLFSCCFERRGPALKWIVCWIYSVSYCCNLKWSLRFSNHSCIRKEKKLEPKPDFFEFNFNPIKYRLQLCSITKKWIEALKKIKKIFRKIYLSFNFCKKLFVGGIAFSFSRDTFFETESQVRKSSKMRAYLRVRFCKIKHVTPQYSILNFSFTWGLWLDVFLSFLLGETWEMIPSCF